MHKAFQRGEYSKIPTYTNKITVIFQIYNVTRVKVIDLKPAFRLKVRSVQMYPCSSERMKDIWSTNVSHAQPFKYKVSYIT